MERWKTLVWDVTCPDTVAPSYREVATSQVGGVTSSVEEKVTKYTILPTHSFTLVAIETLGSTGARSMTFFKELGYYNRQTTVSVAIQNGNTLFVLGSFSGDSDKLFVFALLSSKLFGQ